MLVVFEDGLECKGGVRVWSECVLCGGDDVVVCEVLHDLVVEEGVKDLCCDGEEGYWAVVSWVCGVFGFVEFTLVVLMESG